MLDAPVSIRLAAKQDIPAIRKLKVSLVQQIFSGQTIDFVEKIEDGISLHVIEQGQKVVGVFRVDKQFQYSFAFAAFDTPGVGDFIVDEDSQGRGIGTETCRLLPEYLRHFLPRARGAFFLVNIKNVAAYTAFIRGGCIDTGDQNSRGPTGPQHILWMAI